MAAGDELVEPVDDHVLGAEDRDAATAYKLDIDHLLASAGKLAGASCVSENQLYALARPRTSRAR